MKYAPVRVETTKMIELCDNVFLGWLALSILSSFEMQIPENCDEKCPNVLQFCAPKSSELRECFVNPWKPGVKIYMIAKKIRFHNDWTDFHHPKPKNHQNDQGRIFEFCYSFVHQRAPSSVNIL